MSYQLTNLSKSFDQKNLFTNLNYAFEDTGIYLLKGVSGVGKTTLLRILAGLDSNYSGSISLPSTISVSFQEYRLFPWMNVLENVFVPFFDHKNKSSPHQRAVEILSSLGFNEEEMKLYPSQISGGMAQRVSLARSFITDADLLLLDEPTKELDEESIEKVCNIITELSGKKLIIISTHDQLENRLAIKGIITLK